MTTQSSKENSIFSSFNSEKLSFRLPRWQKDIVDFISEKENINQTDVIRNSINNYFLAGCSPNKGSLKQQSKEKYVQMDLFEWAERNQKERILEDSLSFEEIVDSNVVSVEAVVATPSTERDPFLDFYYSKQ